MTTENGLGIKRRFMNLFQFENVEWVNNCVILKNFLIEKENQNNFTNMLKLIMADSIVAFCLNFGFFLFFLFLFFYSF